MNLRKLWLAVHRWLGLTAGLLFAFAGLTGSLIVFHHELDELLNPHWLQSRSEGSRKSVAQIVEATEQQSPPPGRIVNVFYPRMANGTYTLHFREPDKSSKADTVEVFVDPVTAEVLGQRTRDSGLISVIYRLHSNLLAGESGRSLLGGITLLLLISLCSGLMLWWPLIRKGIRVGLGIRSRMFVYDLHKSVGGLFSPILLLIIVTAVYLTLPNLIKPIVRLVSQETKPPGKIKSTIPEPRTPPIGPDAAAKIAEATMPGCRLMSIELPGKADDSYRVFVRQAGEVGQLRGVGRVWVDQYSGECLATRDWQKFTFADTYFRIQLALHSGDAFGLFGRWLFCLAGLLPTVLYVTGFILWRRRANARLREERFRVEQRVTQLAVSEVVVTIDTVSIP